MGRWAVFWAAIVVGTILNLIVSLDALVIIQAQPVIAPERPAATAAPHPTSSAESENDRNASPSPLPATTLHFVRAVGESEDVAELPASMRGQLVWLRFVFVEVVIVAVGLVLVFASKRSRLPFVWPAATLLYGSQIGLIFAGLIGGLVHASWVATDATGHYVPNLDTTTILWFVLIVIGVYLPRLQKFGIAGAEIEFVAETGAAAATDLADLMVKWVDLVNQLDVWIDADPEPSKVIHDFLRDRAEEAAARMSGAGEYLRFSFWVYSDGGYLRFLQSEQITDDLTKQAKFGSGEGLLGLAYRDGIPRNYADPHSLSGWVEIKGTTRDYNGMLLEPITWENDKIGMLAIDHTAKAEFLPVPVKVAKALAIISARALGSPASKRALERERAAASAAAAATTP